MAPIHILYYAEFVFRLLSGILFDQFYLLLLQVAFTIQNGLIFSQFCVYFPKYNEKSIYLFPDVKTHVAIGGKILVFFKDTCIRFYANSVDPDYAPHFAQDLHCFRSSL